MPSEDTVAPAGELLSTSAKPPPSAPPRATRRAWLGLLVVLGPVLLVAMDSAVLLLTLPHITADLRPTADQTLWIIDIYSFIVGSLLIAFGNLGDRVGRLKLLMAGVAVFGAGSAGAAFSSSPEMLIGFRALMGIGGATLLPSALAVISELFADSRVRARAIAIFAATFAGGFALGPAIGGVLVSRFSWGSVFLINLPVVAAFLLCAPTLLHEVRARREGGIDLASLAASAVGLLLSVYALKRAAAYGPSYGVIGAGAIGLAVLVWFIVRQRTLKYPLVDVGLFRRPTFAVAILTGLLSLVAWGAAGYLGNVYLQSVRGFSVLESALLALPGAAVLIVTCIACPLIAERVGKRTALVICHFSLAAGLGLVLATTSTSGLVWYLGSTMVAAVGYGISFSIVADTAVAAVPVERAGSAGALAETSNEIGFALGIALLGSLAALAFRLLGPGVAPTLGETLEAGIAVPAARAAFMDGFHLAIVILVVMCAGLGLLTLRAIPRTEH